MDGALTERELQMLCSLAGGSSVPRIAERLSISSNTVSTHESQLMEKMDFSINAQTVRYTVG